MRNFAAYMCVAILMSCATPRTERKLQRELDHCDASDIYSCVPEVICASSFKDVEQIFEVGEVGGTNVAVIVGDDGRARSVRFENASNELIIEDC